VEVLYEEIVDAMNALHGVHPGYRAAHAKGTFCSGTFTASDQAAGLSKAAHLQGDPVDVLARFSNGSGDPDARDADRRDGRGLAVKFQLGDGNATDIVAVTIPVFFVKTPQDFLAFLNAREPDPATGEMDMEKVGAFLGEHPETGAAVQLILPALTPPMSFAQTRYFGLHAFAFTNAGGARRFGRYTWVPEAGEANLPEDEIEAADRDYLETEIRERLAASDPVAFTLRVQLAGEGDELDNPTVAWPEDRETVEPVVFDPVNVIDGIECSDDQILDARSKAYSVSAERRAAATA